MAQKHYDQLAKRKGRKTSCTPSIKQDIERQPQASWSPEQISGRYRLYGKPMVSFKTVYTWLYKGLITCDLTVLRRKGKSRQPQETRGKFLIGTPISKRPKDVKKRKTVGHWELVVSSRGKSKGCSATFLERKTRFYLAFKIPDRTAASMFSAIQKKTDLATITDEELFSELFQINHRPRKCLGYRIPFEELLREF
ncbi:IS30 family transposase [Streptococcus loxodontisalivarius]|uniref:IS30 family transposase n=1 Tax=Streptococcus loxodontisalivarius TaxID=1349415 RepID=A0ABS2PTF2_9STRE|nr:IS30 family transposase [Streptococcus loxodontisalivarius]